MILTPKEEAFMKSLTLCVTMSAPLAATANSRTWSSFGSESCGRQRKWMLLHSPRLQRPSSTSSIASSESFSIFWFRFRTSSYSNNNVVESSGTTRPCSINRKTWYDAPDAEYRPECKTFVSITARCCFMKTRYYIQYHSAGLFLDDSHLPYKSTRVGHIDLSRQPHNLVGERPRQDCLGYVSVPTLSPIWTGHSLRPLRKLSGFCV